MNRILKFVKRSAILCTAALLSHTLNAFVQLGNDSELLVDLSGNVKYDSNIASNNTEPSDKQLTVTPMLKYLRQAGLIHIDASAGFEIQRFDKFTTQDTEDFKSNLTLTFPNKEESNYTGDLTAGYNTNTSANIAAAQRTKFKVFNIAGNLRYQTNKKWAVKVNPSFTKSESKTDGQTDHDTFFVRGDVLYNYSEKLELNGSYRYRTVDSSATAARTVDSTDHLFIGGVTGEIMPKITGTFEAGYQFRDFDNAAFADGESPYLSISATWTATDKTTVVISLTRDFESSASEQSSKPFRVNVDLSHVFNDKITGRLGFDYDKTNYFSSGGFERDDEGFAYRAGVDYIFTDQASGYLNLKYADRESSAATSTFDQEVVELGFKYSY